MDIPCSFFKTGETRKLPETIYVKNLPSKQGKLCSFENEGMAIEYKDETLSSMTQPTRMPKRIINDTNLNTKTNTANVDARSNR